MSFTLASITPSVQNLPLVIVLLVLAYNVCFGRRGLDTLSLGQLRALSLIFAFVLPYWWHPIYSSPVLSWSLYLSCGLWGALSCTLGILFIAAMHPLQHASLTD